MPPAPRPTSRLALAGALVLFVGVSAPALAGAAIFLVHDPPAEAQAGADLPVEVTVLSTCRASVETYPQVAVADGCGHTYVTLHWYVTDVDNVVREETQVSNTRVPEGSFVAAPTGGSGLVDFVIPAADVQAPSLTYWFTASQQTRHVQPESTDVYLCGLSPCGWNCLYDRVCVDMDHDHRTVHASAGPYDVDVVAPSG